MISVAQAAEEKKQRTKKSHRINDYDCTLYRWPIYEDFATHFIRRDQIIYVFNIPEHLLCIPDGW